ADGNLKNEVGRTALHYTASKGWVKVTEILLSNGAKVNSKDEVVCTPLHRAASIGKSELCELLIEEGANIDVVDRAGQTPLMSAVICYNKEFLVYIWDKVGIQKAFLDSRSVLSSRQDFHVIPGTMTLFPVSFPDSTRGQSEAVNRVCEIVKTQLAFPGSSVVAPESTFSAVGADSLDIVFNKVQKVSTMDNDQNMIMPAPNYKKNWVRE
ncbi:26S proteasome non-ATPase regulatory subunit 10, partial [Tanacetum coccineum]